MKRTHLYREFTLDVCLLSNVDDPTPSITSGLRNLTEPMFLFDLSEVRQNYQIFGTLNHVPCSASWTDFNVWRPRPLNIKIHDDVKIFLARMASYTRNVHSHWINDMLLCRLLYFCAVVHITWHTKEHIKISAALNVVFNYSFIWYT